MNNNLKISSALQWAWQRSAAVMLCMVLVFFGCKEDKNAQKMDEESFVESLKSAPSVNVSREDLPEWLNQISDDLIISYVGKPTYTSLMPAAIYRGIWDKRTVYYITHPNSNCALCFYYEKGERIHLDRQEEIDKFYTLSKNWELIFQILDGVIVVGEVGGTKSNLSAYNAKISYKYEFPEIINE